MNDYGFIRFDQNGIYSLQKYKITEGNLANSSKIKEIAKRKEFTFDYLFYIYQYSGPFSLFSSVLLALKVSVNVKFKRPHIQNKDNRTKTRV